MTDAHDEARDILGADARYTDIVSGDWRIRLQHRITAALRERDEEIERLAWNLGGCETYALGYNLDLVTDKTMARPALLAVKERMIELQSLKAENEKLFSKATTVPKEYELMYQAGFQNVTDLLGHYGDLRTLVKELVGGFEEILNLHICDPSFHSIDEQVELEHKRFHIADKAIQRAKEAGVE